MKVYDLMMLLAQASPYAEVGVIWDGAAADIEFVEADSKGAVLLMSDNYASMDIRLRDDALGEHNG